MTEDRMALIELAEKHADDDLLRELGQLVLQRLMDAEAEQRCGAGRHERSEDRVNQRNGYRERTLETRIGTMELRIPKLRTGSYLPSFIEPRKASEQALVAVVQEAYVKGISTRKVDDLVQAMGMSGISKSQVSRLCEELDERVEAFLNRPLSGPWAYVWLDATYLKSRERGAVSSQAVVVAVGVSNEGRRETLGMAVGPAETEAFWTEFLRSLVRRGLTGVRLVISDAHEGLKQAIAKVVSAAAWQRCRVHFMRNALAHVPRKQHSMVAAVIRTAFVQENQAEARQQWRETADKLRERFAKVADLMDQAEEDVLAFMRFPKEHWPQLASTNSLERLNKEIKRRSRVVGIFPNNAAIMRLVGTLLAEQTDEWQVTRRYMSQETLARVLGDEDQANLLAQPEAA
ncbi:IS256 family transposase [Haliea sp. E1-2-M8]|uniref:IS256 family transposase n=1 Tax=Haliea sp. E1-2-M8 TaxID=3064706 RepID=UPI002722191A|nr:IS256 family transposase [Haliea sp. E1-2-M8]MDO8863235.1 IS256 family transposase [Haliea sp. E1-2-M8]